MRTVSGWGQGGGAARGEQGGNTEGGGGGSTQAGGPLLLLTAGGAALGKEGQPGAWRASCLTCGRNVLEGHAHHQLGAEPAVQLPAGAAGGGGGGAAAGRGGAGGAEAGSGTVQGGGTQLRGEAHAGQAGLLWQSRPCTLPSQQAAHAAHPPTPSTPHQSPPPPSPPPPSLWLQQFLGVDHREDGAVAVQQRRHVNLVGGAGLGQAADAVRGGGGGHGAVVGAEWKGAAVEAGGPASQPQRC